MGDLGAAIHRLAEETRFSGVVRVDRRDAPTFEVAYGLAHRSPANANNASTCFAIASGSKAFTALAVMSLIEDGLVHLDTRAREVLGDDLPLIDDAVTIEHLLAHRSGIGDYLPEDAGLAVDDYVMTVPVHELDRTEAFLPMLDGRPQVFPPGERFAYNNGGFVVLALLAERVSGRSFHDLVDERVIRPAGLAATAFLRTDEPAADVAVGFLGADGQRTNLLHLPVRGNGDGGLCTNAADVNRFWQALFAGHIVSRGGVDDMVRARSESPEHDMRYGLGLWLHRTRPIVMLEGYDAGVSFRTVHDPQGDLTHTVLANTSAGAWPITKRLDELLLPEP